jgi:hypothetical protein
MPNERVVNGVKTRVLHNKDYVEVAERVRIVHELKKEFEVIESAPFQMGDRCIWRAVVKVDGKQYIGNAEAKLNAPKNTPDGTNPFECAETSALGRALAFAGLGTVESIASYDEIARAQPFTANIQPSPNNVIDAAPASNQLPSPSVPTTKDIYERGLEVGRWTGQNDFIAFVYSCLGITFTSRTNLTSEQRAKLNQAIDEPDPISKAS